MGEKITIEGLESRGWRNGKNGLGLYELANTNLSIDVYSNISVLMWDGNSVGVKTFDELYSHLRYFGLIEPEPITISKVKKIVPKGLINYISEYQISFCLTEDLNAEFFESASGKRGSLWVNGSFLERVKTMQDLRDLCRLMGVENETQL